MKLTVTFLTLLSITSWAVLAKRVDEQKDKREASYASTSGHSPSGYLSSSGGHSAPSYQASSAYEPASSYQPQQSLSHGDASTISVGAGYSIGGAKPSYSFGGHGAGLEGLQAGGHGIQLAPITLQPNQGLVGTDLAQIMSQLQQSLNSGALNLQPSSTVAEFHQGGQTGQALSHGQFNYGSPNLQEYVLAGSVGSAPSYSAGTKGLSSYSSTGPVLFNPSSEAHGNQAALTFAAPSGGHSFGDASSLGGGQSYGGLSLGAPGHSAGLSYGGSGLSLGNLGQSLGASGHSLGGLSLGGAGGHLYGGAGLSLGGSGGHSFGGSGHSLGGSGGHSFGGAGLSLGGSGGHSFGGSGHSLGGSGGHSFGGSGHSLGGSGLSLGSSGHGSGHSLGSAGNSLGGFYKVSSAGHGHGAPGKSAFKPSAYLGASVPSESGHSGLSSSYGASSYPSFGGLSGGHGVNFGGFSSLSGPSKLISPLYTKSEGHGSDSAAAYSTAGHFASPPGTTYGFPAASYPAGGIQSASSDGSQYYTSSSKFPSSSSFGEGSFSYKSPGPSHSSLSSHSSGPKYSFGGHGSSSGRYASSPKDSHGAYSETSYNTIKYSEELKPRAQ